MNTRRTLITGVAAFLAAPAIVRASSIMPVKPFSISAAEEDSDNWLPDYRVHKYWRVEGLDAHGRPIVQFLRTPLGDYMPTSEISVVNKVYIETYHPLLGKVDVEPVFERHDHFTWSKSGVEQIKIGE